jgi:hypothetical protein
MPTDWKSLAKETVHSFDADEVRRSGARPYEVVAALVAELDLFMGRVAAEDDVSIAAVRRKSS